MKVLMNYCSMCVLLDELWMMISILHRSFAYSDNTAVTHTTTSYPQVNSISTPIHI